jgi:hypothetical protein
VLGKEHAYYNTLKQAVFQYPSLCCRRSLVNKNSAFLLRLYYCLCCNAPILVRKKFREKF